MNNRLDDLEAAIITMRSGLLSAQAEIDRLRSLFEAAYLAGFMASGEGWNGEHPFQDRGLDPSDDDYWRERRDVDLARLVNPPKDQETA